MCASEIFVLLLLVAAVVLLISLLMLVLVLFAAVVVVLVPSFFGDDAPFAGDIRLGEISRLNSLSSSGKKNVHSSVCASLSLCGAP